MFNGSYESDYYINHYNGGYTKVDGKFLSYEVSSGSGASVKTITAEVEYHANGKRYICSNILWGLYKEGSSYDWLEDASKNDYVDVYYVNGHPEKSVLDPYGIYGNIHNPGLLYGILFLSASAILFISIPIRLLLSNYRTTKKHAI